MAINVSAFYIMYSDKKRARRGDWRISERTIFVLAVLGGSPGVLLGMKAFRHKTLHKRYSGDNDPSAFDYNIFNLQTYIKSTEWAIHSVLFILFALFSF